MGFVVNAVRSVGRIAAAPVRMVGRAVRSVARNPANIIPVAVGVATGNPYLVAASAGGIMAAKGGNTGQILGSATMSGLGAQAGKMLGGLAGQALAGGGATWPILGMITGQSIGTGLGHAAAHAMHVRQEALMSRKMAQVETAVQANLPESFEEMRENAVLATRRAFEEHGVYAKDTVVENRGPLIYGRYGSPHAVALRRSNIPRYGASRWKDLVKPKRYHG
jgi:hypothetical protein